MDLNKLRERVDYIEKKSLMNKVRWENTTGMDTVSFEKNYMAETSKSIIEHTS